MKQDENRQTKFFISQVYHTNMMVSLSPSRLVKKFML